jgi:hypothetical protein
MAGHGHGTSELTRVPAALAKEFEIALGVDATRPALAAAQREIVAALFDAL